MRVGRFFSGALGLSLLLGCAPSTEGPLVSGSRQGARKGGAWPVARVNGVSLSQTRIRQRLVDQGPMDKYFRTEEGLRELIDDEVRFEILAEAARRRGFASDPEVVDALNRAMVHRLIEKEIELAPGPSEARIKDYYDLHRKEFIQPAKRHIAHIEVSGTPQGISVAAAIIARLSGHPDLNNAFREAARCRSRDDASRQRGGDEGFMTQTALELRFGEAFADHVFRAQVPSLLPEPVRAHESYHVVRVIGQRDPVLRRFEEARGPIRERLALKERSERFGLFVEQLRAAQTVSFDEAAIADLVTSMQAVTPAEAKP